MKAVNYNSLQIREIFHLEFLRCFCRKIKAASYALKGGSNLRFFFGSFRYSEDMDLDIRDIAVDVLKDTVMKILKTSSFHDMLKPFGVQRVVPPDMDRAKQTQTTQRFKIHLVTDAGEDLFTKIEFSRRGFEGSCNVQPVSNTILRAYKLAPLLVPHYGIQSAVIQKTSALAGRSAVQARDIFDLYLLSTQWDPFEKSDAEINKVYFKKALENVFTINFEQFRDTVVSYLSPEDQPTYNTPSLWDEIQLKTSHFIEELQKKP